MSEASPASTVDVPASNRTELEIGLTLSGGGIRAAIFHTGVLLRLADEDLLEKVAQISTVSGGSLILAALFANSGLAWPSSPEYRERTYSLLRDLLTGADLFSLKAVGLSGALRLNKLLITERARVLADQLARRWGVTGDLSSLPDRPYWWINTACLETGKNWRFSKREMGDWQFGRNYNPPYSIAEAAAASAAVPYVIGALRLKVPAAGWYRTDPATRQPLEQAQPSASTVRLWDGGAYENLGLEALWKPQQGLVGCNFLICSDASGPLPRRTCFSAAALLKGHLSSPRLFDIASDQIRALRARILMAAVSAGSVNAALIRMGNSVRESDLKAGRIRPAKHYDHFQTDQQVAVAFKHPTDLKAVAAEVFDSIARHGYELADATLTTYSGTRFPQSIGWVRLPT